MTPRSEQLDRVPPNSREAEYGALGSVLLDRRKVEDVAMHLKPDDFYHPACRELFREMLVLDDGQQPIDVTMLLSRLHERPWFVEVGGSAWMAEVVHSVANAAHAAYYSKIVARHAKLRRLLALGQDLLSEAWTPDADPEDVLSRHELALGGLATQSGEPLATATDLAVEASERIDAICERRGHIGVPTGFESFDEQFGGLFGGELIVLAARPGRGKSALACQIADYVGRTGRLVYIVSLEMTGVELALRSICNLASVDGRKLRNGRIDAADRKSLVEGMATYGTANVRLDRRTDLTIEALRRTARRLMRQGLAIVVLDYLQLLTPTDPRLKRYEQVGQQTRTLKGMAHELNVPVVVLCQLNRQAADEEVPQLHHLRESGSVEQDADVVLFVHRPDSGIQIPDPFAPKKRIKADWPAELLVGKNRNGPVGRVKLDWEPTFTRFTVWGSEIHHAKGYEPAFNDFQ